MERSRKGKHREAEDEAAAELALSDAENARQHRRRVATVYDAVAGRIWSNPATRDEQVGRARVIHHSTRRRPMAPDEVLFRRESAPERYEEFEVYKAHEREVPRGALPESDLLKAVHGYASDFYGALGRKVRARLGERDVDGRSMDETALLAFGILLEEAGREVLGRRGDLVFTEAADGGGRDEVAPADAPEPLVGYQDAGTPCKTARRAPKRRKVAGREDPAC